MTSIEPSMIRAASEARSVISRVPSGIGRMTGRGSSGLAGIFRTCKGFGGFPASGIDVATVMGSARFVNQFAGRSGTCFEGLVLRALQVYTHTEGDAMDD